MEFIIFGDPGSDAGYWVLGPDGWHHEGGWGVDSMREVAVAATVLREAVQFKTPGLTEATTQAVHEFVQRQITEHLGERLQSGSVVILI